MSIQEVSLTHLQYSTHTSSLFPSTQPHSPPYNITELTVKTSLFTGGQDWLADPTDVANLIPKIKDVTFYHKNVIMTTWILSGVDLDAATQVYSEIVTQKEYVVMSSFVLAMYMCSCIAIRPEVLHPLKRRYHKWTQSYTLT